MINDCSLTILVEQAIIEYIKKEFLAKQGLPLILTLFQEVHAVYNKARKSEELPEHNLAGSSMYILCSLTILVGQAISHDQGV